MQVDKTRMNHTHTHNTTHSHTTTHAHTNKHTRACKTISATISPHGSRRRQPMGTAHGRGNWWRVLQHVSSRCWAMGRPRRRLQVPNPPTLNPLLQTPNPKPQTPKPKPQNPKPQTPSPQPKSFARVEGFRYLTPKPQTPNPKPTTHTQILCPCRRLQVHV